jgi:hypothetical protein
MLVLQGTNIREVGTNFKCIPYPQCMSRQTAGVIQCRGANVVADVAGQYLVSLRSDPLWAHPVSTGVDNT